MSDSFERSFSVVNNPNGDRALTGLFSVDAWYADFDEQDCCTFHIDITFSEAKLGGDGIAAVKFSLRLKRAEVSVKVPEREGFQVLKKTVDRSVPREVSMASDTEVSGEASAGTSLKLGVTGFSGALNAQAKMSAQTITKLSNAEVCRPMAIRHKFIDGEYGWELVAREGVLDGPAWDANAEPRFTIKDRRALEQRISDKKGNIDPVVMVLVTCRREDMVFDDIELVDPEKAALFSRKPNWAKKLAAAESHLRDLLVRNGLPVSEKRGDYVSYVLAQRAAVRN